MGSKDPLFYCPVVLVEMTEKIEQIIKAEIESSGASFIGVELRGRPGTFRLSVFVDTESGISLGECTMILKKLIVLP